MQRDAASVSKVSELMHDEGDSPLEFLDNTCDRVCLDTARDGRGGGAPGGASPPAPEEPLSILVFGHEVAPRTQTDDSHSTSAAIPIMRSAWRLLRSRRHQDARGAFTGQVLGPVLEATGLLSLIPTMLLVGLVLGRWWRVVIPVAAIGWTVLLMATGVGSGLAFALGQRCSPRRPTLGVRVSGRMARVASDDWGSTRKMKSGVVDLSFPHEHTRRAIDA